MNQLRELADAPKHIVVICGGAVAGSEAAALCAARGALVVVVEQNPRPFGKIEDGLPRWHEKLRDKEYQRIGANLTQPGVLLMPETRLGRDIGWQELLDRWQPSAVILANGAWRDRPVPVEGIDQYVDRGLVYQNPFVYWFNHYHEKGYSGPRYEVLDETMVLGGGLASIDVVKIINLELYAAALRKRGIDISVVELEHRGIDRIVARHGLKAEELGVKGCTLYYRRRKKDMPLASPPPNATPEQLRKTETVRTKVMDNCIKKYLVRLEECHAPVGAVIENDRLVGIRFRRTEMRDGRLVQLDGTDYDVRAPLVISSIGSVPEPLPGIPTKGELYDYTNWDTGELRGLSGVFGLGNVLTGKGNIKESRVNAKEVGEQIVSGYLGLDSSEASTAAMSDEVHAAARAAAEPLAEKALSGKAAPASAVARVLENVERRWQQVGYDGDYRAWLERHPA